MAPLALINGELMIDRNSCRRRRSLCLDQAGNHQNHRNSKNRILQEHLISSSSEGETRRDLKLAGARALCALNVRDRSKGRGAVIQVWDGVVRMIERIGRRRSQLESNTLCNVETLE